MSDADQLQQLRTDYGTCFKTTAGRKVLAHLLTVGHVYEPCHVPGDPYSTAFRDGQRDMAVMVLMHLSEITDEVRRDFDKLEDERRAWEEKYGQKAPF